VAHLGHALYFPKASKTLSTTIAPPTTAGISPDKFSEDLFFARHRKAPVAILALFLVLGFALRVNDLGAESLGEDELNKLETVQEYRTNGLSGKNGEHPFLMKGLQTLSIAGAEIWNKAAATENTRISEEAALRFPIALFGTFTALLIFLVVAELFGRSAGLVAAILWTVEPVAIGFDRIAKEDSLVLFFFLLTSFFWLRSQTAAEQGKENWTRYVWAAAAAFAGLMASKYYPHLLAIFGAYYIIFVSIPSHRWDMGKVRWLKFFAVMGVAFLILNPTILLPETWREMVKFSTEKRIGHDSYEFMGQLYPNQMSKWLAGVPWTFYYVFIAVKTSLLTLVLFLIGLPLMFRRKLGDGRYFLFFWAFMWFMPFTVLGGKFTRYFTLAEPLILITAAVAFCYVTSLVSKRLPVLPMRALQIVLLTIVAAVPLINALSVAPHFRMFTNAIGGGMAAAGTYFPHDEFYDAATGDVVNEIARQAPIGSTVACETPALFDYYAGKVEREDLKFVSLSDPEKVKSLETGDYVVITKGRRYMSNTAIQDHLERSQTSTPIFVLGTVAAEIYALNEETVAGITNLAN
jgi:hypothetical protein